MLGDSAADEFMIAWEKAHQKIAKVFINVEQKIYQEKIPHNCEKGTAL